MSTPVLSAAQRMQQAHEQSQLAPASSTVPQTAEILTEDPFPVANLFPSSSSSSSKPATTSTKNVNVEDQDAFPSLGGGPAPKAAAAVTAGGWGSNKIKQAPQVPTTNNNGNRGTTLSGSGDSATLNFSIPTNQIHIAAPASSTLEGSQRRNGLFSNDPRLKSGPPTTLGEVLKQLQQTRENQQARVTIQASSSSKLTTFIIKAYKPAAVKKGGPSAQEEVERVKTELLAWLEKKVKDQVQVPKALRAFIIGAKGRTLKAITDSTGCSIQIPRDDEIPSTENQDDDDDELGPLISITLSGPSSAVESAKSQILAIVRERTSKTTQALTDIPAELWIFLRSKVEQLVERTLGEQDKDNVTVSVPRKVPARGLKGVDVEDQVDGDQGFNQDDKDKAVRVTGDKEFVRSVVTAIYDEVNELRSTIRPVIFSLPKRQHRFLVGNAIADQILEQSGCAIEVPPADNDSEDVVVRGPSRETIKAMQLVMDLASATPVEQLDLLTAHRGTHDARVYARSLSRYLLLKKRLRQIAEQTETKIYVPRPSSISSSSPNAFLEIVGTANGGEQVAKARGAVIAEVRKLPPTVFEQVEIEELVHRYLIGKRGVKVKALEKDNKVEVVFPREGEHSDEILVVYVGEDATQAKAALEATTASLVSLAAEFKDLVTLTIEIPASLHGAVIGTGGTTLNAVLGEDKLAHVQFGGNGETQQDQVSIRGPKDEAERVKKELERIAEEAKKEEIVNSHVVEFEIETSLVRHVVGKAGAGVNKLRDDLGVKVDFVELSTSDKKGNKLSKVTIKGRKENAEEAAKRVKSTATKMADEITLTIPLPTSLDRGSLIGKQGTYLKRLEDKYEVRINFPRNNAKSSDDQPSGSATSSSSEIVIRGPSKGAQAAKGELVDLISYEKEHGNTVSFTVSVKALPRILGRGGAQINSIKDETGVASVDVDQESPEDQEATITLRGTKASIKSARQEIEKIAKEVDDEARIEIEIPKEYHTTLIGSGGSSIRDLITRSGGPSDGRASGNMVRFPRQGDASNTVTIIAPSSIATKIRAELEKEIASLDSRVVWGVVVAQSNHAAVIGKGAQALQELQRKHGVKIYMPGWNDYAEAGQVENKDEPELVDAQEKDLVKVVGPKDSVLAAAVDLQAVKGRGGNQSDTSTPNHGNSTPQHSVKVLVPKQYHAVVAQGGRFFRSLPNGTKVSHEGVKPPSSALKAKKPPVPLGQNGSTARIDDAGEDDSSAAASEGIEFQLVPLHENGASTENGDDEDVIPWVVESRNQEDAEKVAEEIKKSLERAKEATHVGWVTVPRGLMPRIVGRGGSGLDRLRSTGVEVEVVGKRDANQLTLTGSPEAIESAREIIESLNAPRQRRERDEYY
ncbi:Scp160p [Sporobolomyces koalae]|uniref:Scp160p n=1 Tax=Sporobolomyces koalae TaxID=500713 RepID=UPI00316EF4DE